MQGQVCSSNIPWIQFLSLDWMFVVVFGSCRTNLPILAASLLSFLSSCCLIGTSSGPYNMDGTATFNHNSLAKYAQVLVRQYLIKMKMFFSINEHIQGLSNTYDLRILMIYIFLWTHVLTQHLNLLIHSYLLL